MRANVLLGIAFSVLFLVRAAFPQAAAESVMLHANSATATAKAGTALGNGLNDASNKLGNQVQTLTQPKAGSTQHATAGGGTTVVHHTTHSVPAAKTGNKSGNNGAAPKPNYTGSLITSIRGGRVTPAPAAQNRSDSSPAPATPAAQPQK